MINDGTAFKNKPEGLVKIISLDEREMKNNVKKKKKPSRKNVKNAKWLCQ